MSQRVEKKILEGLFQINKGGKLVFLTESKAPTTPLPDLSKLPEEIVRQIATYLRTPSAECIARHMFLTSGEHEFGKTLMTDWCFVESGSQASVARTYFTKRNTHLTHVNMLGTSVTDCGRNRASEC
jgi:hypothetical protein